MKDGECSNLLLLKILKLNDILELIPVQANFFKTQETLKGARNNVENRDKERAPKCYFLVMAQTLQQ